MKRLPSYSRRLLIGVIVAFPASLLVASAVWTDEGGGDSGWWERLVAISFFFSLAGVVATSILSVSHTWLIRRGYIARKPSSILVAVAIGLVLGALLGASWSWLAVFSIGGWGVLLGLLYAIAVDFLD